jgi:hypothetical protein
MASDFSTLGRSARALIPVPDVPLDSIRRRSHAARTRSRAALFAACAAVALGAASVGTGVGAKISSGVQVWLSGGKSTLAVHSGVIMRYPTASELRSAIAGATFPVVFPVGIPAGSNVWMVTSAPAGHPSVITVSYENGAGFKPAFALVDPAVVDTDGASLPSGSALPPLQATYHFRVGGELVLSLEKYISADDLNRIKDAMTNATPRESLALTEAMLAKMTILPGNLRIKAAERYRPPSGRSVLLEGAYLRTIPDLVKHHQPLLDRRIARVSNVKYANGDLASAVVQPPTAVAISAGGVRAIDAVFLSAHEARSRNDCGCEVLFNEPTDGATYQLWKIPLSSPGAVRHYSVDAKTFAVTLLPASRP